MDVRTFTARNKFDDQDELALARWEDDGGPPLPIVEPDESTKRLDATSVAPRAVPPPYGLGGADVPIHSMPVT